MHDVWGKTVKILTLSDAGAVSFYRAHGPLIENGVRVLHPRVDQQIDWVDIMAADAVWMTRALLSEHVEICQQVKAVGKPLILDYDDAIFSVPVSNSSWEEHLKFPGSTIEACKLADLVLFSTEGVKQDFLGHGCEPKACRVVRNRAGWKISRVHNADSKLVAWRGSPTHSRDIDAYIPEVVKYCKSVQAEEFRFFGYLHDALLGQLSKAGIKVTFEPSKSVHAYMRTLIDLKPHSVVIPLVKGAFNDAKSDIAATEALAAGALPVVFGDPNEFSWIKKCNEEYSLVSDDAIERDEEARRDFAKVLSDVQNF